MTQPPKPPENRPAVITTAPPPPKTLRRILVDAALLAVMLASVIYAPESHYPTLIWAIASGCATLLSRRGVDWRALWYQAAGL